MSDSRLEKFIYAICSMDVTDLPVPLSRIEKLWNCLITGETPDFEPLSRNEKYLMAMLDRYDISNLPAPMSRGEKLLYKIAVGETDLSDVPNYLSRYEELLKYLIENGGISGGDFEYVLYTLNQSLHTLYTTAEKPVKSAILKGQTLVNLVDYSHSNSLDFTKQNNGHWSISVENNSKNLYLYNPLNQPLKDNTLYTVIVDVTKNNLSKELILLNGYTIGIGIEVPLGYIGKLKLAFTTKSSGAGGWNQRLQTVVLSGTTGEIELGDYILLEGDYTNQDIPYFEGMQSVKMPVLTTTGKNLLNRQTMSGGYIDESGILQTNNTDLASDFIRISPNTNYTYKVFTDKMYGMRFSFFDKNKSMIERTDSFNISSGGYKTYTSPSGAYYVRTHSNGFDTIGFDAGISLVMGDTPLDTYESYKSNILTVNEDVELRGIGDVKDTLDCLTGELTERIGEIIIDENSNIAFPSYCENVDEGYFKFATDYIEQPKNNNYISNKLQKIDVYELTNAVGFTLIGGNGNYRYLFCIKSSELSELSLNGCKQWLAQNPLTIQYQLKTESIKTVDLTTVDQDNQPTQLGTFENITHVSLESAGLIPEVEMEVATNLLEDTVFNLTNAFNTLYPTAAKPVVDGTLTGQTLVNLATQKSGRFNGTRFLRIPLSYTLKSNTNYFVNFIVKESTLTDGVTCRFKNTSTGNTLGALKSSGIIAVNTNVPDILEIYIDNTDDVTNGLDAIIDDIMVIEYQEGMENWGIPHFEGMESVRMPDVMMVGKNLFDKTKVKYNTTVESGNGGEGHNPLYMTSDFIKVEPNTNYISSHMGVVVYYDKNRNFLTCLDTPTLPRNFTTPNNCKYIRVRCWEQYNNIEKQKEIVELEQLEKGSTVTPYEPHKSIILSTPSDLELRKVGEVQDEVNVMTGEVVERIGEIVLDGSENWKEYVASGTSLKRFVCEDKILNAKSYNEISNILPNNGESWLKDITNLSIDGVKKIVIQFNSSDSRYNYSLDEFKQWLSQNPVTVQYELATESIKTVDLTVINQDGNETKLRTFDDTTHVLLQSEGLVPTASLTVRTKIPSASSTSLLMDDISNNQQQLETTVDEQSNNVDATMIATTEIYEETL